MKEGIYLIDKPAGWTSFDVVAWFRNRMSDVGDRKKPRIKVGHSGTLDPFATGLLIIMVGKKFTKRQSEFMKLDKDYEATLKLGFSSSTGDPEGEIIKNSKFEIRNLKREDIEQALKQFVGEIEQTPPVHSAIKIKGQRAYKKARKGEKFEMPKRKVTIYELDLIDYKFPEVSFRVRCSSGTYVRTLGQDIAKTLGTVGYLTKLRRTQIGDYGISEAKGIKNYEKE